MRLRRLGSFSRAVIQGLFVHHAFDHAATMAFYFFLGIIPLLVLGGFVLGHLVHHDGAAGPGPQLDLLMSGPTGAQLREELHALTSTETGHVAPISLIGFLWLTSNGFHNLMDVFELLIGARPRSWWRQRLMALCWVAATLATAIGATWVLLEANGALEAVHTAAPGHQLAGRIPRGLAAGLAAVDVIAVLVGLCTLSLASFYRFAVEHPRAVRRRVWPGTVVAMTLWVVTSCAFGAWVSTIGHYAVYYGSLATVAVLLLWLYLTSLSLLVGAEVNARLEGVGNRTLIPL